MYKNRIIHICKKSLRGPLFISDEDRLRFTDYLYHFNNKSCCPLKKAKRIRPQTPNELVDIICYSLTSDQFDLVLIEKSPGNASIFLKKICTGYSMYFNKKYNRRGRLFGRGQTIIIKSDETLLAISKYIHLCPLKGFAPISKKPQLKNIETINFFRTYPWSSYRAYALSDKNYVVKTRHDLFKTNPEEYQFFVEDYIFFK